MYSLSEESDLFQRMPVVDTREELDLTAATALVSIVWRSVIVVTAIAGLFPLALAAVASAAVRVQYMLGSDHVEHCPAMWPAKNFLHLKYPLFFLKRSHSLSDNLEMGLEVVSLLVLCQETTSFSFPFSLSYHPHGNHFSLSYQEPQSI